MSNSTEKLQHATALEQRHWYAEALVQSSIAHQSSSNLVVQVEQNAFAPPAKIVWSSVLYYQLLSCGAFYERPLE